MDPETPALRHPVRAVALVGVVVALAALAGSWAAEISGNYPSPLVALLVGLGYGLFLGAVSVGWVLALDLPPMRWWWAASSLPVLSMGPIAFGAANGADIFTGWFPIALYVSRFLLVAWLVAACLLSLAGWWRYMRRRQAIVES